MGAPLNPVPNVLKVYMKGWVDTLDTREWGNVLHFGYTGTAPSNATCATIASQVSTQWGTHMAPEAPSPGSVNYIQVTDLTSVTSGEGLWTGSVAGTRGDDSIPANAAVLVSYAAPSRYKGGHPRTYLFAGGNADLQGAAEWSTAFQAEVLSHWQAFLDALIGYSSGGCTLASFCSIRYRGKFLPNAGPPKYYLTTPVVQTLNVATAVVAAEMASQRRRIGRVKK
jgi:hypothetical protein